MCEYWCVCDFVDCLCVFCCCCELVVDFDEFVFVCFDVGEFEFDVGCLWCVFGCYEYV